MLSVSFFRRSGSRREGNFGGDGKKLCLLSLFNSYSCFYSWIAATLSDAFEEQQGSKNLELSADIVICQWPLEGARA